MAYCNKKISDYSSDILFNTIDNYYLTTAIN